MARYTNNQCQEQVRQKNEFQNNNDTLYGGWPSDSVYAVYSYGIHHPIFIWANGQWFENSDSYSCTTSKHHRQLRPVPDTIPLTNILMRRLAKAGYEGLVKWRLNGGKI